jgi:hypothetical protein
MRKDRRTDINRRIFTTFSCERAKNRHRNQIYFLRKKWLKLCVHISFKSQRSEFNLHCNTEFPVSRWLINSEVFLWLLFPASGLAIYVLIVNYFFIYIKENRFYVLFSFRYNLLSCNAEAEYISFSYFCNFNYDSEYKDKLETFVSSAHILASSSQLRNLPSFFWEFLISKSPR